jgi:hypothetical protein
VKLLQWFGIEKMELVATVATSSNEASLLEDVEVLGDGLTARSDAVLDRQPGAELEERLAVPLRELIEDQSSGLVGKGPEHIAHR